MKTLTIITMLLFSVNLLAHHIKGQRVEVPSEHLYIPKGYDSNDNIELIVEGYLPNLCYKNPGTDIEIKGNQIHVQLNAFSRDDGQVACAEMIVPFVHTFSIGILDQGNYEVIVNNKQRGELFVEESTSSAIDDHIYANVESVQRVAGESRVVVKGHHPSDCLEFDRFEIFHNDKDVYSVLPITKQVADFCPLKMIPFSYELDIPNYLDSDRVLLHLRSLNGRSVNELFYNR